MAKSKYYEGFSYTNERHESRVGAPEPFYDALGRLAVNFSELEDALAEAIASLLRADKGASDIVTSGLSFRRKLDLLNSLYRRDQRDDLDQFRELVALCGKAEDLRNRIIHSSWVYLRQLNLIRRRKASVRGNRGYTVDTEDVTASEILDVADYIAYAAEMVESFFEIEAPAFVGLGSCQLSREM